MKELVHHYKNNFTDFKANDFFKNGWTHETTVEAFYTNRKELSDIEKYSSPEPFNYKR